jgi:AhpD family alkylhydroperoxidase
MTSPRIDYRKASPGAAQAMYALEKHVASSRIEKPLYELVKIRTSQINGCAYCLDMHTQDARAAGETEQRIYALSAWRETPFFTDRERAALAWAEALTLVAFERVPDALFDETRSQFSETELVDLTLGVIAINGWNRIAVAFRLPPGNYQPVVKSASA